MTHNLLESMWGLAPLIHSESKGATGRMGKDVGEEEGEREGENERLL